MIGWYCFVLYCIVIDFAIEVYRSFVISVDGRSQRSRILDASEQGGGATVAREGER